MGVVIETKDPTFPFPDDEVVSLGDRRHAHRNGDLEMRRQGLGFTRSGQR